MTQAPEKGSLPWPRTRLGVLAALLLAGGCAARGADPAVMDSLAEMEIRMRLLQAELNDVRQALAEREEARSTENDDLLYTRLDDLQQRMDELPARLADLCPAPPQNATVNTPCPDGPDVQRVVVSGDKLVVGQEERVWVEPPSAFLVAHINPAAEHSRLHTEEVVEFERDGSRWVRFAVGAAGADESDEPVMVERPLQRTTRVDGDRRPIVELRVQLGDVREAVEFALMPLTESNRPMVLGRNFLTDVALVDVARKYVQPAFEAPQGQ